MKFGLLTFLTTVTLFGVLPIPVRLAAQNASSLMLLARARPQVRDRGPLLRASTRRGKLEPRRARRQAGPSLFFTASGCKPALNINRDFATRCSSTKGLRPRSAPNQRARLQCAVTATRRPSALGLRIASSSDCP